MFKFISLLLVLLLCSCGLEDQISKTPRSPDDPPEPGPKTSLEKSSRDTSLTEHKEIKRTDIESTEQELPSRYNDHIITKPPEGNKGGAGGSDPLKKRELKPRLVE